VIKHPFQAVPFGRRAQVFLPLLILTLLVFADVIYWGGWLYTSAAPYGIVSFELAGDPIVAARILKSWNVPAQMEACTNLGLDYLFLVLYSTTLAFACVWASSQLSGFWSAIGGWIAWGQWAAGAFDAGENSSLLYILFVTPASPWPQLARFCSLAKFTLVTIGLLYSAMGAFVYFANKLSIRFAKPAPEPE
jgi:hypothetical protein